MRKRRTRFAILLTTGLLTLSVANADAQAIKIPPKGASPTIDRIEAAGTLTAGAAILGPWLLQDPKTSNYIGPVAYLAQAAADALKVKLVYHDATWDTLVAGLVAQKYDIAAAAILETKQRAKVIGFVNFGHSGTCYVVRPDSPIHSLADLDNPKLVYLGYTGLANGTMFHQKYQKTQMQTISPPPGYAPRVPDVLNGRGDIAALDSPMALRVHQKWPDARMIPSPEDCLTHPDLSRPIGIGYPRGDKAFAGFLAEVIQVNQQKIDEQTLRFSQSALQ